MGDQATGQGTRRRRDQPRRRQRGARPSTAATSASPAIVSVASCEAYTIRVRSGESLEGGDGDRIVGHRRVRDLRALARRDQGRPRLGQRAERVRLEPLELDLHRVELQVAGEDRAGAEAVAARRRVVTGASLGHRLVDRRPLGVALHAPAAGRGVQQRRQLWRVAHGARS
jgi:hypothetical protein